MGPPGALGLFLQPVRPLSGLASGFALAARTVHHLLWLGRFSPRDARPACDESSALQPAGPGQASRLDERAFRSFIAEPGCGMRWNCHRSIGYSIAGASSISTTDTAGWRPGSEITSRRIVVLPAKRRFVRGPVGAVSMFSRCSWKAAHSRRSSTRPSTHSGGSFPRCRFTSRSTRTC